MSTPALAFDRSARTPHDLKAFFSADPLAAAKWAQNVGRAALAKSEALTALEHVLSSNTTDSLKAEQVRQLVELKPELLDLVGAAGELQAARTQTMKWVAEPELPWVEAPAFTGRLTLVDGVPSLETTRGVFSLNYDGYHWRDEVETVFLNHVVTVKGFPSQDGKTVSLSQFAPGSSDDFVSGRVLVKGDKVLIAPQNKRGYSAEVTDPTLVALLKGLPDSNVASYDTAGVILPGKVVVEDGKALYRGTAADGFYLLARVMEAPAAGATEVNLESGYNVPSVGAVAAGFTLSPEVLPGAAVGPEGDTTVGDATFGKARRSFFFIKPTPNPAADDAFPTRRFELLWAGKAADVGEHSDLKPVAQNLKQVAQVVPAATEAVAGFAPDGLKP